ncbi:hypothetical protein M8818_003081 [Zalaria obscura]|uniref:Uncharacterized protein n=1 Tax=Zalaria obscura TaxID=2024903 RepID=A0ACC3SJ14_9PEZI
MARVAFAIAAIASIVLPLGQLELRLNHTNPVRNSAARGTPLPSRNRHTSTKRNVLPPNHSDKNTHDRHDGEAALVATAIESAASVEACQRDDTARGAASRGVQAAHAARGGNGLLTKSGDSVCYQ